MLDAIDSLVESIRSSGLLSPAQLGEFSSELASRYGDTDSLSQELLRRGWLTALQIELIAKGRARDLLLGPYVLLESLGQGGMGQVFKARHQLMDRLVALKVIRQERQESAEAIRRFQREIRAVASLSHPNILAAYHADHADDRLYFVMEYVEGIDLAKRVKAKGCLQVAQACDYARQAALGLQHAQEHGLVHRDIKPSNLLLATNGTIKLLDMGLARQQQFEQENNSLDPLTDYGAVMGTADYIAPEQAEDSRTTDIRSDIYSLGCTLYHLLTGKPPFPGGTLLEKLRKHQTLEPPPLEAIRPDAPREVGKIVRRMMAKRPAERFQKPLEVATALEPFSQGTLAVQPLPVSASLDPAAVLLDQEDMDVGMALTATASGGDTDSRDEADLWRPICNWPEPAAAAEPHTPAPPPARVPSRRRRRLTLVAAGILLTAGLSAFALTVVRIDTSTGTLIIESEDRDVAILVKRGGKEVQVIDLKEKHTIDLPVGEYEAALTRGRNGLRLKTHTFEIVRGRDTLVTVRWEPAAMPAVTRAKDSAQKRVTATPTPVVIRPDPLDLAAGEPMSRMALVSRPAPIKGLASWTLETQRHRGPVNVVAYRKDGRFLASGGQDGIVRLWDPLTRRQVRALVGHDQEIHGLAWSPDGRILASASWDGTLRLWEADSGQVRVLRGHDGPVSCLAWSPDSQKIASGKWRGDGRRIAPGKWGAVGAVYLWDVNSGDARTVLSHADGISALAWSTDGKTVACGTWGPGLIMLDAVSGKRLVFHNSKDQPGRVFSLAYSADGKLLAAGNDTDGAVRLWDARSGVLLKTLQPKIGTVQALAWAPDGATLAAGGWSATALFNVPGQKSLALLRQENGVCRVAWSPEGKALAVGSSNGLAYWDATTYQRLDDSPAPPPYPSTAAWSGDGKILAVGTSAGTIGLWDTKLPRPPRHLQIHGGFINTLAWSPDGKVLATASHDTTARLWHADTGQPLRTLAARDRIFGMGWSPDGKAIISVLANGTLCGWDPESGQVLFEQNSAPRFDLPPEGVRGLAFSPDGRIVATDSEQGLHLWEAKSGDPRGVLLTFDQFNEVAISPDGYFRGSPELEQHLIYVTQSERGQETLTPEEFTKKYAWKNDPARVRLIGPGADPVTKPPKLAPKPGPVTLRIDPAPLKIKEGAALSPLALVNRPAPIKGVRSWTVETRFGHRGHVRSVRYSPDERWLASGGQDGTVRLWDLEGRQVRILVGHSGPVMALAWSPDSRFLASGSTDGTWRGTLHIWDAHTGLLLHAVEAGPVNQVAWAPNSGMLATAAAPGVVRVWEARSARLRKTLPRQPGGIAWAPDGRTLAIGNDASQVILWDSVEDRELTTFMHGGSRVGAVAWSPDGKLLASASAEHVHLWNIPARRLRAGLNKLPGADLLAWSADGKTLAVQRNMRAIEVLDLNTGNSIGKHGSTPLRGDWLGGLQPLFISISSSPKQGLALGCLDGSVRVWDPQGHATRALRGRTTLIHAFAWHPRKELLALGAEDGWIHLWNSATTDVVDIPEGGPIAVSSLAWSPDGAVLASGTMDQIIRLWDSQGQRRTTLHEESVHCYHPAGLGWSPDSKVLAAARADGTMTFWSIAPKKALFSWKHARLCAFAWSPDGKFIASGSSDGSLRVWDYPLRKPLHLLIKEGGDVHSVSWSADSKTLASVSQYGPVYLWDAAAGARSGILDNDGHWPTEARWSPIGKTVAVSQTGMHFHLGSPASIRFWVFGSDKSLPLLTGHSGRTLRSALSWRADGKYLASASIDETARVWDPNSGCVATLLIVEHSLVRISPDGHYCGGPATERNLVYVVQTERGQETLDAGEFARRYGWKNEPRRAVLLDR